MKDRVEKFLIALLVCWVFYQITLSVLGIVIVFLPFLILLAPDIITFGPEKK